MGKLNLNIEQCKLIRYLMCQPPVLFEKIHLCKDTLRIFKCPQVSCKWVMLRFCETFFPASTSASRHRVFLCAGSQETETQGERHEKIRTVFNAANRLSRIDQRCNSTHASLLPSDNPFDSLGRCNGDSVRSVVATLVWSNIGWFDSVEVVCNWRSLQG